MRDFAAIDFETANNERTSVCSVGVVIVRDGEIVDSFYSLIQPEPNYYSYWNTKVHGLTRQDTEEAPVFPEVWKQIEPMIEVCRLWRITNRLMRVVSRLCSVATRWIIRIISSIVLVWHREGLFLNCLTISCILYQNTAVIT